MNLFQDITVLDLSKIVAGPYCAMTLGDLGAKVIKVEDPQGGDDSRKFPPFQNGVSTTFMALNRNKKGIVLDLKKDNDLKTFYELVKKADVVVEGYRTGVAEKLKIDYISLKKINPNIIYCSISGYGRRGPMSNKGGYDLLVQAYGGFMSITGNGEHAPPVRGGYSIADITTGMIAATAVITALYKRLKTGEGSYVETSLLHSQVGLMSYYSTMYHATKDVPMPRGSSHPNFAPYQAFEAKDGYFVMGVSNDKQWETLCSLQPFQHLKSKEIFMSNSLRISNLKQLVEEIEAITTHYSKREMIDLLEQVNIPVGPINTIPEVLEDPQVNFYNMIVEMDHPKFGKFLSTGVPFQIQGLDFQYDQSPPEKGEHTDEILGQLDQRSMK